MWYSSFSLTLYFPSIQRCNFIPVYSGNLTLTSEYTNRSVRSSSFTLSRQMPLRIRAPPATLCMQRFLYRWRKHIIPYANCNSQPFSHRTAINFERKSSIIDCNVLFFSSLFPLFCAFTSLTHRTMWQSINSDRSVSSDYASKCRNNYLPRMRFLKHVEPRERIIGRSRDFFFCEAILVTRTVAVWNML